MTDKSSSSHLHLTDDQRINWLRLIRTENVGPATFRDLINRFGSAKMAIEMLPELALKGGFGRRLKIPSVAEAETELERAQKYGARIVAIGESDYPFMLKTMEQPPPLISVKGGSEKFFTRPSVAIVGGRNASLAGIKMVRKLARELGEMGHVVISGLARGIDTAAHEGSLATGTVAVYAGGLDCPYPAENIPLSKEIIENDGALISEMPFGWQPKSQDFPRRNRLVVGLALGVVVIEAARRSGSLISARLAGEMGRIVFAVPGSPLDPRCAGSNQLLKDGATLVTRVMDVAEQLLPLAGMSVDQGESFDEVEYFEPILPPDDNERAFVINALGPTPVEVDEIIRHTKLPTAKVLSILLELELAGRLERHAGNSVTIVYGASHS